MNHPKPQACPVCHGEVLSRFLRQLEVPVNCSALCATADQAQSVPRGDIELAFCPECGMVFNAAFEPRLLAYDASYENSLRFSPAFCEYADSLASRLVEEYSLRGKDIVEIGCGDGEFLRRICLEGGNSGMGFDPSLVGEPSAPNVTFVKRSYDELASNTSADFICSRHVLEHIQQPRSLLLSVHRALSSRPGSAAYFEVPDAMAVLDGPATWDINYPHCSYFTSVSLKRLLESCGFGVLKVSNAFGRQFLSVEAAPRPSTARVLASPRILEVRKLARIVERFSLHFREAVEQWARFLEYAHAEGRRVVLWGAGAKAVTFLNSIPGAQRLTAVVDLNPRKQGCFVPGTAHEVLAPARLASVGPDVIISLNPVYEQEIRRSAGEMGLAAEVVTQPGIPIFPPKAFSHTSTMVQKMS